MLITHIVALGDIIRVHNETIKPVLLINIHTGMIMWGNKASCEFFNVDNIHTLCEQNISFSTLLYKNMFQIYRIFQNDNIVLQNDVLDFSSLLNKKEKKGIMGGINYSIDTSKIFTTIRCWQMIDGTDVLGLTLDVLKNPDSIDEEQNFYTQEEDEKSGADTIDFQEIIDKVPKIVMIFDESGICVYRNEEVSKCLAFADTDSLIFKDIMSDEDIKMINFHRKYTTYLPLLSQKDSRFSVSFQLISQNNKKYILAVFDDVEHFFHMRNLLEEEVYTLRHMLDLVTVFSWKCSVDGCFERIEVNENASSIDYDSLFKNTPKQWEDQGILVGDNHFNTIFLQQPESWQCSCVLKLPEIKKGISDNKKTLFLNFFGKKVQLQDNNTRIDTSHSKEYYVGVALSNGLFNDKIIDMFGPNKDSEEERLQDESNENKDLEYNNLTHINSTPMSEPIPPQQNMRDILLTIKKELEVTIEEDGDTLSQDKNKKSQIKKEENLHMSRIDSYHTDDEELFSNKTERKISQENISNIEKTRQEKNSHTKFFIDDQQMHDLRNLINQMTMFISVYNQGEAHEFDNEYRQGIDLCSKKLINLLETFKQKSEKSMKHTNIVSMIPDVNYCQIDDKKKNNYAKQDNNISIKNNDKSDLTVSEQDIPVSHMMHLIFEELKKRSQEKQVILRCVMNPHESKDYSILESRAQEFKKAVVELMYYRIKKCLVNSMIMISVTYKQDKEIHMVIKDNGDDTETDEVDIATTDHDSVEADKKNMSFDEAQQEIIKNLFAKCDASFTIKSKEELGTETVVIIPL